MSKKDETLKGIKTPSRRKFFTNPIQKKPLKYEKKIIQYNL